MKRNHKPDTRRACLVLAERLRCLCVITVLPGGFTITVPELSYEISNVRWLKEEMTNPERHPCLSRSGDNLVPLSLKLVAPNNTTRAMDSKLPRFEALQGFNLRKYSIENTLGCPVGIVIGLFLASTKSFGILHTYPARFDFIFGVILAPGSPFKLLSYL